MNTVEPSSQPLQQLLKAIDEGKVQLPNLQRDFKWTRPRIKALLETVQKNHPTGSLLFLKTPRTSDPPFGAIPFRYSAPKAEALPEYLVLDGQQRLTSCYVALFNKGSLEAGTSYYIDLLKLHGLHVNRGPGEEIDFLDAIQHSRWNASPGQFLQSKHWLSFSLLRTSDDSNRPREVLKDALRAYRNAIRETDDFGEATAYYDFVENELEGYLEGFYAYAFPVIILPETLSVAAVCKIFETINSQGLKLGAFDLAVASFIRQGEDLKSRWAAAKENESVAALDKDGTNLLQTVALLAGKPSKKAGLPQALTAKDIADNWSNAMRGMELAAKLIGDTGGGNPPSSQYLPYDGILPALATVLHRLEALKLSDLARSKARNDVIRWYFSSALGQRYNEGTDVLQSQDRDEVFNYAIGPASASPPIGMGIQPWSVSSWSNASPSGAIGKALLCVLNFEGPKDPVMVAKVGLGASSVSTQLHHIFPRAYLRDRLPEGAKSRRINSMLNQTFLSAETNRFVSKAAPSQYIGELVSQIQKASSFDKEGATKALRECLRGHLIDDDAWNALLKDDYDAFLRFRARRFAEVLQTKFFVQLRDLSESPEEEDALSLEEESDGEDDDSDTVVLSLREDDGEYKTGT